MRILAVWFKHPFDMRVQRPRHSDTRIVEVDHLAQKAAPTSCSSGSSIEGMQAAKWHQPDRIDPALQPMDDFSPLQ
jgi:hypothetical protein